METKLNKFKNIRAENCVTIILNTHRTIPENEKDVITLKNLVNEAEKRLLEQNPKREVWGIIDNLKEVAESIDHQFNMESLILFANKEIADFIRLPIRVVNRVIIDETFATRDLTRALHAEMHYFVLVLNQDKSRLIEAFNDKVIKEEKEVFPIENKLKFAAGNAEPSNASRQRNLLKEYFNQVDKAVNQARKENPLPVLISSDENGYFDYLSVADERPSIFDFYLKRSNQNENANAIVTDAWELMEDFVQNKQLNRLEELEKAVGQNKFLSDVNEIRRGISEGRIQTLFVQQGLFQPAVLEDDLIYFVESDRKNDKEVIDDIYDELIEENFRFGGDVVFLPKGKLDKFNGFGATTRY